MRITLSADTPTKVEADLLAVGITSLKEVESLGALDKAAGGIAALAEAEGFEAKSGQTLLVPLRGRVQASWLLLVGLSAKDSPATAARKLGYAATKAAKQRKTVAVSLADAPADAVRAAAEGATWGGYVYGEYKTGARKPKGGASKVLLLVNESTKELRAAATAGAVVAEYTNLARDLVNAPPNDLTPLTLTDIAVAEAKKLKLETTVWGMEELTEKGMELFLAVNRGSVIPPRMIHIAYKPKNATKKIVFVGKGLTFDAGGLCLKPAKSMVDMKCDMAGSATTLGVVFAAAKLKLPVEVHAVVGSTENMTGAAAYRPGDVFKSFQGKTVEIINTDAEGRLVLADCLAWATKELSPDIMIDHATLTGACMVALGPHRAGLYAVDDELAGAYKAAAVEAGEEFWQMPLDETLRPMLDSPIADLKNIGGPHGGATTAALFLREFVGKTRWMHLDIAGPSFNDRPHGVQPKGGTGFGVSTAVRFLEALD